MARRAWVLLAVVGLAVTAGCLGGDAVPGTTTAAPTTTAPAPTTQAPTTTAPEPTTTTTTPTPTTTTAPTPAVKVSVVNPPERIRWRGGELTVQIANPADVAQSYNSTLVANRTHGTWYSQTYEFEGQLSPGETHRATFTVHWDATGTRALVLNGERVALVEAYATGGGGGGSDSGTTTNQPDPVANGSVTGGATAR